MFDIGFGEMLILGAIALVVIGPKDLPKIARTLGRTLNDFKRAFQSAAKETTSSVTEEFHKVRHEIEAAERDIKDVGNPNPDVLSKAEPDDRKKS